MTGGRCKKRRKMMGRGVDGGCGTEEKPCPLSRTRGAAGGEAEVATARGVAVNLYAQASKALSERCPFDTEEELLRVPTIPAGLSAYLSKHSYGHRKHRKFQGDPATNPSSHPPVVSKVYNVWKETDEYFRPITLADIDTLISKFPLFNPVDSCFYIPIMEHALEKNKNDVIFDEGGIEVSSKLKVAAKEEAEKTEVAVEEDRHAMEIDSVATCSRTPLPAQEEEESSSLNWLLGSKQRAILTTERPSKKRKLLGGDAGLEQLILLPNSQEGRGSSPPCDLCCLGDRRVISDRLISCVSCNVLVHQKCYGTHEGKDGYWLCSWCKNLEVVGRAPDKEGEDSSLRPCLLCPKEGGALKPVGGNLEGDVEKKFVHLFCSLWTPEVYVEDTGEMEPVMNIQGVQETQTRLVCYLCKVKHGVCVRCSHGTCRTAFHPICAREAKHQMEVWGNFGFDNVELRAFCVKHSSLQDIDTAKISKNLTRTASDASSVSKSLPATLLRKKLPKLRLNCKNKDKSMAQAEMMSSISDAVVKDETALEQDALALWLSPESCDVQSKKNTDIGVIESINSLSNTCDLILVLKKLIDRGKINVGDVASEIGILPDPLEAALRGETSSLPTELRSKVIKWFQDSVHMPSSMRHLKIKNGSAKSVGVDGPNAANVTDPHVPDGVKMANPDNADACTVKSLPRCRKTKNKRRILKEDNAICSSGEKCQQSCNKKLVNEIDEVLVVHTEGMKGDTIRNMFPIHDQACSHKEQVPLKEILEDRHSFPDSKPYVDLPQKIEGNPAKLENNDFSEAPHQPQCMVENVFSSIPGNGQSDEANITTCSTTKSYRWGFQNCDVDSVVSATPGLNGCGSCSSSYVHPFIQKRLMQVQNNVLFKQKSREADSNGHSGNRIFSTKMAAYASDLCNHQPLPPTCTDMDQMLDATELDQLHKAKSMGILELSPEDEVEGEMLYLQNMLLDNSVAIKHSCDDLICRVVQKLPQELDALKKQRWDLALVNLFLQEVREAKKRGRKERKRKEAQAVLAAAAAAAAASSRNSLLRKDANDEISAHQESPLKVSAVCGRAAVNSPLVSRLKETLSRSAIVKVSPEKNSGIFQMPDFSKENALSCDICRRTETLLKRIFVCSGCKIAVHSDCYCSLKDPIGSWKCELCEEMLSQSRSPRNQTVESRDRSYAVVQCGLCGGGTGAFRKTTDGQWVHAFCAEWLLESTFKRGQKNLVDGMDAIAKERDLVSCCICHHKLGVCLKCSYGHCESTFHPSCARNAGFYMNLKAIGGRLQHKAYCEKHSLEQRQKADSQQYGAEELKSIKQMRVELEKVRLLCERIIKREKLKRDLALCSHDVLASRRDYVAFSVFIRSSFPPGVSSESATTSIDNRSYSGTIQRSDDITVDSTVSGKRRVRLPLDIDKRTDDSSTSQPSFKHKIADRTVFSGKQLPHRPAYAPFQSLANDGEKRFKARKPSETFHKELVMTSHQASMQNQRLPKGFAYVPIGYVPKEIPVLHDSESHEPREPGG